MNLLRLLPTSEAESLFQQGNDFQGRAAHVCAPVRKGMGQQEGK